MQSQQFSEAMLFFKTLFQRSTLLSTKINVGVFCWFIWCSVNCARKNTSQMHPSLSFSFSLLQEWYLTVYCCCRSKLFVLLPTFIWECTRPLRRLQNCKILTAPLHEAAKSMSHHIFTKTTVIGIATLCPIWIVCAHKSAENMFDFLKFNCRL